MTTETTQSNHFADPSNAASGGGDAALDMRLCPSGKGRVLIAAGSDSGGGAGIQADIKAVTMMGGYAMTALTALTAQNTLGVHGVHPVPLDFVDLQMRVVLDDLGADVIKTGMLGTTACIQAVVQALDAYAPSVPVVVDPVMRAKGGHALLQDSAVRCLIDHLLPRATLVTPNVPEAEVLVGYSITTPDDMARAALDILAMGPRAVVMKGGHLPGDALVDVLVVQAGSQQAQRNFLGQRHHSRHTHGTGCTLASAIAARLACGDTLAQAVQVARDYVEKAIAAAPGFGQGHGPLGHGHPLNTAGT